jgi:hypothetical protein
MIIGHNLHRTNRLEKHRAEGYRIKMSCGGGMGGSSWYEYVTHIDSSDPNYETVTTLDGQTKRLGKQFTVTIVEVDFHGQTVDISDWCDGGCRQSNNPVYTEWFDVAKGEEVTWVDGDGDNGKMDNRIKPCLVQTPVLEGV